MRLIDAEATIKCLRDVRCKDCDRRKGMKNGKVRFCYEIGDVPCRACDIGDAIDYLDISPTIDAVPVVRCGNCKHWRKLLLNHDGCGVCHADNLVRVSNQGWYCADGERRINTNDQD